MVEVLLEDAQKEKAVYDEIDKTMKKLEPQVQSGAIDYDKMYGMVKKQVFKEKKFTP